MWESAGRLAKIWPSSIKITGRRKSPRVQRTNSARSAMENAWPTIATSKWLDRQSRKTSSRQMAAVTSKPAERRAAVLALPDRLIRWKEYLLMLSYIDRPWAVPRLMNALWSSISVGPATLRDIQLGSDKTISKRWTNFGPSVPRDLI